MNLKGSRGNVGDEDLVCVVILAATESRKSSHRGEGKGCATEEREEAHSESQIGGLVGNVLTVFASM